MPHSIARWLYEFCVWLDLTPLSQWIRAHGGSVIPTVQTIHILSTNQWKPNAARDPATDTYATPELWTNFADFYQRATKASKIALDAAHAKRADEFRSLIAELRQACNGCHAAYQKTD